MSKNLHGYYIEDLSEGMSASYAKTVTEADVVLFASVSGDDNPVHINDEFASQTVFKGRIVHGMFCASLISCAAGTRLPGPGGIYIDQQLSFKAPVRIGDTVTAMVAVTHIDRKRRRIVAKTQCLVKDDIVVDGTATFLVDSREQS